MGSVLQAEQAVPATLIRPQPTADFCDENPSALVLQNGFISCGGSSACVGPVETICTSDDNSLVKATLREAGAGRVLLIDNIIAADADGVVFLASYAAQNHGVR